MQFPQKSSSETHKDIIFNEYQFFGIRKNGDNSLGYCIVLRCGFRSNQYGRGGNSPRRDYDCAGRLDLSWSTSSPRQKGQGFPRNNPFTSAVPYNSCDVNGKARASLDVSAASRVNGNRRDLL